MFNKQNKIILALVVTIVVSYYLLAKYKVLEGFRAKQPQIKPDNN